ncbi:MAG: hypothetical protein Q8M24_08400 [Pseudolabrys sp.]|nr:hypothetical protein [Pseudolabrys sp.]MDP2295467.1 hypothetical protein [Pseudolabrys sp.]
MRDRVRVLERENASLIRQLNYAESEWTRLRNTYEPLPEHAPEEVSHARAIETETTQRQRSAASLASGEGDDAEYLELARQAAWDAVEGMTKFIKATLEGNANPYPAGWPEALPKHVVCNRYVQLDDTGTSLASWDKVEGGHSIAHPGAPVGTPVPLVNEKPKGPSTWLAALAEKRGLHLVD